MRTHAARGRSPQGSYNSYSRSPSPRGRYTRSSVRTRTPSYSDSFESEDEKTKKSPRRGAPPKRAGGRRPGNKKGGKEKASGRMSPRMLDVVARRMLSAKRVKVNDLRNEVDLLKGQIDTLRKENKLLQAQSRRQEKALDKVEGANAELPSLIERHNEELRAVKEQLRRTKEKLEGSQRRNKELDASLARVTAQLHKLKELTEDKSLKEREVLTRRVNQLEDDVDERDRKIRDLERYIENLQKNHRHELSIEVHRHKETQKRLGALESQLSSVENDLKEKEKILEIQNIYSQRVVRAPHHLASSGSTPLHFPSRRKLHTGGSAEIGLTPREKAKVYEERRREEERRKALTDTEEEPSGDEARSKKLESSSMQNIAEIDNDASDRVSESGKESEEENFLEMERERREEEQRQEKERKREEERKKEEERFERERREAEEREQEEAERREREREEAERQRREREREEEERRRRAEEERRRQEEEEAAAAQRRKEFEELQAREAEERRKKDALLAKLKAVESTEETRKPKSDPDDFFLTRRSPEAPAYAAPKHHVDGDEDSIPEIPTLDLATGQQSSGRRAKEQQQQQPPQPPAGRNSSSTVHSSASSKKQYSFKEQVENMHAGRPAYDDVSVPYLERQRRGSHSSEDDQLRNAVYGRRGSTKKPPPAPPTGAKAGKGRDREAQLMEELFGPPGAAPAPAKPVSRDASPAGARLPWEVDEGGDRMLPRRPSQPRNSIYGRRESTPPGAIDDIEELTL